MTRSSSRKKRLVAKTSLKLPRVGQSWAKEPCKGKGGGAPRGICLLASPPFLSVPSLWRETLSHCCVQVG